MTTRLALAFHPEAVDELDAAVEWYEGQTIGAGADLLAEIIEVIGLVAEFPRSGAPTIGFDAERDVRLSALRRHPFLVVTTRVAAHRLVIAVAHTRRAPGYWRQRLR